MKSRFRVRAPRIYNPRFGGGFCFLYHQLIGLSVNSIFLLSPYPLRGGTEWWYIHEYDDTAN